MRLLLIVTAVSLAGCPLDGPSRWAAAPVAVVSLSTPKSDTPLEPVTPTLAPPEVSPDCTCSPKCTCNGCQCDAELQKNIAEIPEAKHFPKEEMSPKPENGDTSRESVDGGDTSFDVLIEVPAADQGYCLHCHTWLHGDGKNSESFTIQRAGHSVGVIYDTDWQQGELLPRIYVRGKLIGTGAIPASRILPLLRQPAPQSSGGAPSRGSIYTASPVPVVRVIVGESKAGGVSVGSNNVLTASHVAHAGWPQSVDVNGKVYPATVIGDDPEHDLALLHYDGPTVPSIAVARSEPAEGTAATAYGFPAGGALQKHATTISRRWGNYSAVGLYHSRHPFAPGDSGGPVVNSVGELVGIVTGTDTRARVGLVVDQPSIVAFLDKSAAASQLTRPEGSREAKAAGGVAQDVSTPLVSNH